MANQLEQKVKVLKFLRIANPIVMFAIVLFALHGIMNVPLVLSVSIACLFAIFAFTVISIVLSAQKKKLSNFKKKT